MAKSKLKEANSVDINQLTPSRIVEELDKYIIGQDDAKRAVAIALRNRWRRQQVLGNLKDEIYPNNIILIGPTGVGKTEIARRLAKITGAPFTKVEASKFTEVGYVGKDVESMVRELTDLAVNMVKDEIMKANESKAATIAEEKILDILIPPVKNKSADSNEGDAAEDLANSRTRERFREKLRAGELDDKLIEYDSSATPTVGMQVIGPVGLDDMGISLQEILGGFLPKQKKKKKTTLKEAKRIILQEENEKLIDMEIVQRIAIKKVESSGMIFIDEIDKIASSGSKSGTDVSREGVQRDLLPIVEGTNVNTKYGIVKTDHILFIAAGAFHVSKPSDLIPELQGRFPIRVELKSLTENDFLKILTMPENALLKQYKALLETEKINIDFKDDAIKEIARIATLVNEQVENIGARRLHTILSNLLEDILFNAPDRIKTKKINITGNDVRTKLDCIVEDKDLSKYIL